MDFRELEEKLVAFRDARGWKGYHTPNMFIGIKQWRIY